MLSQLSSYNLISKLLDSSFQPKQILLNLQAVRISLTLWKRSLSLIWEFVLEGWISWSIPGDGLMMREWLSSTKTREVLGSSPTSCDAEHVLRNPTNQKIQFGKLQRKYTFGKCTSENRNLKNFTKLGNQLFFLFSCICAIFVLLSTRGCSGRTK